VSDPTYQPPTDPPTEESWVARTIDAMVRFSVLRSCLPSALESGFLDDIENISRYFDEAIARETKCKSGDYVVLSDKTGKPVEQLKTIPGAKPAKS